MNTIFSYNTNAKYSTKDLKGGNDNINFSLLDVYLDEKGPSVKIQLSNIFRDHHIAAKPSTTSVGYDEWSLTNALWMKFYNSHGKCRPELNECFHTYRCQLNIALFCARSALGISWQHLNHPNLPVRSTPPCLMKTVLANLKMLILTVHITASVINIALMRLEHGCIGIGFIRLVMVFLVMK